MLIFLSNLMEQLEFRNLNIGYSQIKFFTDTHAILN